ncbi:tyrosine-type recombinase/integrase [Robbsia andropogonis]|uniref:tyrosine-type recombinase/integrase n=1 Tax=Robbsia andropogonis TaxID=28092 RepID=UPI003D255D17
MNARRRVKKTPWPQRVYARDGSFYWVRPNDQKWIRLCRVTDGETRMLERLAEEKRKIEIDPDAGSMPILVATYISAFESEYSESFRKEWKRRGEVVKIAFRNFDIQQVDAGAVDDFLRENWPKKLPTQKAMHGWLSKFFAWAVVRRHVAANPLREVSVKKPPVRTIYIPNDHFLSIRAALATYSYEKTIKGEKRTITAMVPTGAMMQIFVDLCYLTMQRSTDIRMLRKSQIDRVGGVIHFLPSKTKDSSAVPVDWPITPEIDEVLRRAAKLEPLSEFVVRDETGKPKTAAAVRDAWQEAKRRAKLSNAPYTVKDIRAKAMTDANIEGYDLDALQVAGAHTDRDTTADYIKSRLVPVSKVRIALPAAANGFENPSSVDRNSSN